MSAPDGGGDAWIEWGGPVQAQARTQAQSHAVWGSVLVLAGVLVGVMLASAMARLRYGASDASDARACRLAWRRWRAPAGADLASMPNPYGDAGGGRGVWLASDTDGAATVLGTATLARALPTRGVVIAARAAELVAFDPEKTLLSPFSAARREARLVAARGTTRASTVVPLRWAESLGVYLVQMRIGDTDVRMAADSGSSMCVVGTDSCKGCNTYAFGGYAPPAEQFRARHDASEYVALHYGSQSVVSAVVTDSITLRGFDTLSGAFQDMLARGPEAALLRAGDSGGGGATAAVDGVRGRVHAAFRMTGDTQASILGLAPDAGGAGWIQEMMAAAPDGADVEWGAALGDKWGALVLGAPPANCASDGRTLCDAVRVPLQRAPHFERPAGGRGTQFYQTVMVRLLAGTSMRNLRTLQLKPRGGLPMYLTMDTGCTETYVSADVSRAMWAQVARPAGRDADRLLLVAELMGARGEPTFVVLNDPEFHVRGSWPSLNTRDPLVDDILRTSGVMWGCLNQRGIYIHSNVTQRSFLFANTAAYASE